MSDEDVEPSGPDDAVWSSDADQPWPADFDAEDPAAEDPAAGDPDAGDDGFDDEGDELPSATGGSKGRLLIGLALLLIGVIIAVVAYQQSGDDDGGPTASKPEGKLVASSLPATTTSKVPATIVPTTRPGGELPTGCGDWDQAFSFNDEPLEGVTIYSDFQGWHVRLAPDGPPVVTGTIVGQATPLVSTEPPGPGVQLIADPATMTVSYRLTAGEEPVGFDFAADCAQKQLTFDLKDDAGAPLDPKVIHLGRKGGVTALPIVAQRTMAAG